MRHKLLDRVATTAREPRLDARTRLRGRRLSVGAQHLDVPGAAEVRQATLLHGRKRARGLCLGHWLGPTHAADHRHGRALAAGRIAVGTYHRRQRVGHEPLVDVLALGEAENEKGVGQVAVIAHTDPSVGGMHVEHVFERAPIRVFAVHAGTHRYGFSVGPLVGGAAQEVVLHHFDKHQGGRTRVIVLLEHAAAPVGVRDRLVPLEAGPSRVRAPDVAPPALARRTRRHHGEALDEQKGKDSALACALHLAVAAHLDGPLSSEVGGSGPPLGRHVDGAVPHPPVVELQVDDQAKQLADVGGDRGRRVRVQAERAHVGRKPRRAALVRVVPFEAVVERHSPGLVAEVRRDPVSGRLHVHDAQPPIGSIKAHTAPHARLYASRCSIGVCGGLRRREDAYASAETERLHFEDAQHHARCVAAQQAPT